MRAVVAFLVLAGGVFGAGCAVARERATVCKLSESPSEFEGKEIIVHAQIRHNGMDVSELVDPVCPDTQISFRWTKDPGKLAGLKALRSALFNQRSLGTVGKNISADFVGMFVVERFGSSLENALVVEQALGLTVESAPAER